MKRDQMYSTRDWTDLPLLSSIADRLGLIELLRFRAVCKAWYAASSFASADIEALPDRNPWFIEYDSDNSQCTLATEKFTKKNILDVPELKETECLASIEGWLLLFCEGSMFFFCPLSRARIDIPGTFSHTVINKHVTFLSALPTSKGCIVGVVSQTGTVIELHAMRFAMEPLVGPSTSWNLDEAKLSLAEASCEKPATEEEERNRMKELKEGLGLDLVFAGRLCILKTIGFLRQVQGLNPGSIR
ncbi:NAD(P)-binding Rossmann-fold superfamily protein, putative isoform 1 [Hibiscus syriacus]|uniref:NAD(P)-binding Rossmann-fold superfamily protein, putative isoform 1 n=1 Tax=Hibiscus syriacus TaxID=106335 RepID=A0A6A2ZPM5_HIBSY|nr:NAD(P)-binding Rossmann-fold superfamily protein, putative isoform 1 [Hibiscus syriacus]